MRLVALGACLILLGAGCEEELTVPGKCPEFCPGGQPEVRDTLIAALPGSDTTFVGYAGWNELPALLTSEGLPGGDARAWYRFAPRSDSVVVSDSTKPYTVDSVSLGVNIVSRDTTVQGLVLFFHRIPNTVDTLTTFAELDGMLSDSTLIDSLVVPDSVRRGGVKLVLKGSGLDRLPFAPEDSGRLSVGMRMRAELGSGVRFGSIAGPTGAPTFTTFVRVETTDTSKQHQTIVLSAVANGYAHEHGGTITDPDLLWVGRVPAGRTMIRFQVPKAILDSSTLLRATLELSPAEPMFGLRTDPAAMVVRTIVKDVGAKSTPSLLAQGFRLLPTEGTAPVGIDVFNVVQLWKGAQGLPQVLLAAVQPEGGTFQQPVFNSTRSASGAPGLRLTYVKPAPVEKP